MKNYTFILTIIILTFASNLYSQFTAPPTTEQSLPEISSGNFKAETFIAPDNSFRIDLPAHEVKSVKKITASEIQIDGSGTKYTWANNDFQLSVKAVFSEKFYDNKTPNSKENFWQENNKQIKEFVGYEGGNILSEKDLKTDDYLYKEFQISFKENSLNVWRYYFTGTKMFSVTLILAKAEAKESALKYLDTFKILK